MGRSVRSTALLEAGVRPCPRCPAAAGRELETRVSSLAPGLVHGEGLPWPSVAISGMDIRNMPAPGHRVLGAHLQLQRWGRGFGLDRLGLGSWFVFLLLPHLLVCSEMSSKVCRLLAVLRPVESM